MADHGEWVECVQLPSQSTLHQQMSTSGAPSGVLGDLVMQSVACLLTCNHEALGRPLKGHLSTRCSGCGLPTTSNLGSSSKMSNMDRDALQIVESKIIQSKINSQAREKALQAADEVSYGQLGIQQGSISDG